MSTKHSKRLRGTNHFKDEASAMACFKVDAIGLGQLVATGRVQFTKPWSGQRVPNGLSVLLDEAGRYWVKG